MGPNSNGQQPEQQQQEAENFPLDDALISLLADIKTHQQQVEQQVMALNAQRQGALVLFIRQHKLQGNWQVAENGKELVKAPEPVPAPKP